MSATPAVPTARSGFARERAALSLPGRIPLLLLLLPVHAEPRRDGTSQDIPQEITTEKIDRAAAEWAPARVAMNIYVDHAPRVLEGRTEADRPVRCD